MNMTLRRTLLLSIGLFGACTGPAEPRRHPLEARLVEALVAEDPRVSHRAVFLLGNHGSESHVQSVGALVDNPDAGLARSAVAALARLGSGDPSSEMLVAPHLIRALQARDWVVRRDAASELSRLRSVQSLSAAPLTAALNDESGWVQIAAGGALVQLELPIPKDDLERIFRSYAGGSGSRQLLPLLNAFRDPSQNEWLSPLLNSDDARVRDYAEQAARRIEALAAGAPFNWQTPTMSKEMKSLATNERAQAALRGLTWHPVERAELLDACRGARLVLVGELHRSEGPLRDTQIELLRAFASPSPDRDALGYEAPVKDAQKLVLDAAEELRIKCLPLERNWESGWSPVGSSAERDDQVAEAINDWLSQPTHRLFVVRGESHVLPAGYLVRQLDEEPLIVLTDLAESSMPLELADDDLGALGKTWRLGDGRHIYVCSVAELLDGEEAGPLRDWLGLR